MRYSSWRQPQAGIGKKKVSDTRFPMESDGPPKATNDSPLVSHAPFCAELSAVCSPVGCSGFRLTESAGC